MGMGMGMGMAPGTAMSVNHHKIPGAFRQTVPYRRPEPE